MVTVVKRDEEVALEYMKIAEREQKLKELAWLEGFNGEFAEE